MPLTKQITIQGTEIEIDKTIVPIIESLNANEILTLSCCSGLKVDHPELESVGSGYLCLVYSDIVFNALKKIATEKELQLEKNEKEIHITLLAKNDDAILLSWAAIWESLIQ